MLTVLQVMVSWLLDGRLLNKIIKATFFGIIWSVLYFQKQIKYLSVEVKSRADLFYGDCLLLEFRCLLGDGVGLPKTFQPVSRFSCQFFQPRSVGLSSVLKILEF
jgi:hypothetical protein